jgi:hypothetical protein
MGDRRQDVTEARASRLARITLLRRLELEWCCRKSVRDERCIKVVDYSLVVDVAMEIWLMGKQLNGAENERQAAASR